MLSKIDDSHTKKIRDAVNDDGYYFGPLYTEDEINALLDMDEGWNEDLPTALVEEGFLRQTGIAVDMAVQGAAALNLVKADTNEAEFQEHNTVSVEKSRILERVYETDDPDYHLVPSVTPEDPNRAVKSIDFAGGKARATKLDLITLDANENPVESALIDQITVVQALQYFGANVEGLVEHIETTWGIDYVRQLINNVALAPVADVARYMATGGRPTPQIYLSSNYSSAFRVINRPTAPLEKLGYTSAFFARSAAIAKMIACTVQMVHGSLPVPALRFNTNPAQFNKFNMSSLVGVTLNPKTPRMLSTLASTVKGLDDYEKFLSSRQAVKHIDAIQRKLAARDLLEIEKASAVPATMTYASAMKRLSIFDPKLSVHYQEVVRDEIAAPSRVTTMLFSFAHNISEPREYVLAYEAILCMLGVVASCNEATDLPRAYATLVAIPGTKYMLDSINVERTRAAIEEIDHMLKLQSDSRRTVAVYLLNRHRAMSRANHISALKTYFQWHVEKKLPTDLKETGELTVAGIERPLRFLLHLMNSTYNMRPYIYMNKLNGIVINRTFAVSVFDRRMAENVEDMAWFSGWYDKFMDKQKAEKEKTGNRLNKSGKKVYVPKAKIAEMLAIKQAKTDKAVANVEFNIVFSKMRASWSRFYESQANAHLGMLRLLASIKPGMTSDLAMISQNKTYQNEPKYEEILAAGAVVEFVVHSARSCAYSMCRIEFCNVSKSSAPSLDKYAEMLSEIDKSKIRDSFKLLMKEEYLNSKSASQEKMYKDIDKVMAYCPWVKSDRKSLIRVYKTSYVQSEKRIIRSIEEMIVRDMNIMVQEIESDEESEIEEIFDDFQQQINANELTQSLEKTTANMSNTDWSEVFASARYDSGDTPEWAREVSSQIAGVSWALIDSEPLLGENLTYIEENLPSKAETVLALKNRFESVGRLCDHASSMDENCMHMIFDHNDMEEIAYLKSCIDQGAKNFSIIN
nr:hypothetical protein [Bremia lactucae associated yuevirus-like virus 2]